MFLLRLLKNKYFLTALGIVSWLLFFDRNDVFSQWKLMQRCRKLERDRNYYIAEIEKNREALKELQTNRKSLETFARETYLMKRDNEDVFVFVTK